MFDELKEVLQKNHKFQESYNVKNFKEIQRFKSLQAKAQALLEHKRGSKFFWNIFNGLLFFL